MVFVFKKNIFFILIYLFIEIICQDEILHFYQEFNTDTLVYTWERCYEKCYTCNEGPDNPTTPTNQNCLSCNPKEGRYLLDGDSVSNCYTESELPNDNTSPTYPITYFLDTKHVPNKWIACHENCETCSDKPAYKTDSTTLAQMNCIKCKTGYIKVNTFCYQAAGDTNIGFTVPGESSPKHCGDFVDDETGQQLGIESGTECIIKPESSFFPNDDPSELLKKCDDSAYNDENCLECDYDSAAGIKCNKCKENFMFYKTLSSTTCQCPKYLGIESSTNKCVNCKYSPEGPYKLGSVCTSTKTDGSGTTYNIANTTYNILTKCQRPCLTCDASGRCESCLPNYFLDRKALGISTITDNNEICLTYNECALIGFPDVNFYECYFCDTNYYKLIDENVCKERLSLNLNDYYFIKAGYPALGYCHERCATCDGPHRGDYYQNCNTCKSGYQHNTQTKNCDDIPTPPVEDKSCPQDELYYLDKDSTNAYKQLKCISGSDYVQKNILFYILMKEYVLRVMILPLLIDILVDLLKRLPIQQQVPLLQILIIIFVQELEFIFQKIYLILKNIGII